MYKIASVLVCLAYACHARRQAVTSTATRQTATKKSRLWSDEVTTPASLAEVRESNGRAGYKETTAFSPYKALPWLLLSFLRASAFNVPWHPMHGQSPATRVQLGRGSIIMANASADDDEVFSTASRPTSPRPIVDKETSYDSVARWPPLKIFTFAEPATRADQVSIKFPGARTLIEGDPVTDTFGQAFGFMHHAMLPVVNLDPQELTGEIENDDTLNSLIEPLAKLARSDFRLHLIGTYTSLLSSRLEKRTQGSVAGDMQNYRMSMLTYWTSYADADEANIALSVQTLNTAINPVEPERPLFEEKLEHLMTIQFFTPAQALSRAWSDLGYDKAIFGFDGPVWDDFETWKVGEQGIAHHVHLLADTANDGYLTFQGSANLGIFLDVHADLGKYEPDMEDASFVDSVDDANWGDIELRDLRDCHTGLCKTLKALIQNEDFPRLAERISRLKSLTIVGHSAGGSLGTMLAKIAYEIKNRHLEELAPTSLD